MLNSNRWSKSWDYFSYIDNLKADNTDDSVLYIIKLRWLLYTALNYIFYLFSICKFKAENETVEG